MKTKSLVAALALGLIVGVSYAQKPGFVHKPFAQYQGDTLKYLERNFCPGTGPYIGRPLSELLDNLEIEVKSTYYRKCVSEDKVCTVSLLFSDKGTIKRNRETKIQQIKMFITLDQFPPVQDFRTIYNAEPDQVVPFTSQIRELLKGQKISRWSAVSVFRMY